MKRALVTCGLSTAFLLASHGAPAEAQQAAPKAPSLYQRLGGFDKLAAVFDDVAPRLFADPQLARFFSGHSMDSNLRQRQRLLELLCQESGGPCTYTGRPLGVAHKGLGITAADWGVFQKHFAASLEHLSIGAREQGELTELVARYKADIVEKP